MTLRQSMIRDEFERLQGECDVVCEVTRGHVGTGRLHIDLPRGSLLHLKDQIGDIDVDVDTGRAWCRSECVSTVREVANALASAR